jgi:hypothetical protein
VVVFGMPGISEIMPSVKPFRINTCSLIVTHEMTGQYGRHYQYTGIFDRATEVVALYFVNCKPDGSQVE